MNNKNIIKNATPLIDLRSPIEFEKGSLISSVNIPILDNDERAQVGIEYKINGQEEAIKLGYKLLEHKKEKIVSNWREFILSNPSCYIYCMRGGKRSKIAQSWLKEVDINVPIIKDGYKSLRNSSINILESVKNDNKDWIILAGRTGTGKTAILKNIKSSIDLENIAQHRGSAFGSMQIPQPTIINFENTLSYKYINHYHKILVLEDESSRIGRVLIPKLWYAKMQKSKIILLNLAMDQRINNIIQEYIEEPLCNGISKEQLNKNLLSSLYNIRKRLGLDIYNKTKDQINKAFCKSDEDYHRDWIGSLLKNYYDPMYDYQLSTKMDRCIANTNKDEVISLINKLEKD